MDNNIAEERAGADLQRDEGRLIGLKKYLFNYAEEHSDCLKKKVAAALIDDTGSLASTGHGGPDKPCKVCTRKTKDWQQDGCMSVHSEMRAIFDYLKNENIHAEFDELKRMSIWVTHGPCDQCIKLMVHLGIKVCYYFTPYHNDYRSKWEGQITIIEAETGEVVCQ